jgi:hypothetical protein
LIYKDAQIELDIFHRRRRAFFGIKCQPDGAVGSLKAFDVEDLEAPMKKLVGTVLLVVVSLVVQPRLQAQKRPKESVPLPQYKMRVDVVERLATAINYRHRSGATTIGFRGTALQPGARGEAKVESKKGYIEVEAEFDDMIPANRYGREYLTYVMWAVTPQGRSMNLGELVLKGTRSKLDVTTGLQAFALVVTAEPYFAVTQPSDRVVLENVLRQSTEGRAEQITARYQLVEKGAFSFDRTPKRLRQPTLDMALPLDLQQARNAVRIAQWAGAEDAAWDVMAHAEDLLDQAEAYYVRKAGDKVVSAVARETVQTAEDARLIALRSSRSRR